MKFFKKNRLLTILFMVLVIVIVYSFFIVEEGIEPSNCPAGALLDEECNSQYIGFVKRKNSCQYKCKQVNNRPRWVGVNDEEGSSIKVGNRTWGCNTSEISNKGVNNGYKVQCLSRQPPPNSSGNNSSGNTFWTITSLDKP